MYFIQLVGLLALTLITGCTGPVRVDGQPQMSMGSSRFVISSASCHQLISRASILPLDIYHMGECYEQGVAVSLSVDQAIKHYQEAARWGVPEAKTALERLNQPVPSADLQKQQEKRSRQMQQDPRDENRIRIIHSEDP